MALAVAPTWLDPNLLAALLPAAADRGVIGRLQRAVADDARCAWERDLLDALGQKDNRAREALVNEQLTEFDWRTQRWARVPRVCASIATSSGFLMASLSLLLALGAGAGDGGVDGARAAALGAPVAMLMMGVAGTSFCIAVHVRSGRIIRERLASADRLVDRLESTPAAESGLAP